VRDGSVDLCIEREGDSTGVRVIGRRGDLRVTVIS
jgi:hypothetical protein